MSRRLKPEQAEAFAFVAGRSLPEFTRLLADHDPAQLAAALAERPELAGFLDGVRTGDGRALLVSRHPDALIGIESGYGDGKKPGDYLEGFRQFVLDHQNDIAALKTVMTRPRDLTRRELKALALRLDQAGYPISALQTAWKELTNQDIAASLIGFIRQQALGSALIPYRDRVAKALAKLLATQPWTAPQRQWLGRIAEAIKNDVVVDRAALDEGQFRVTGGFARLDKIFDGKLDKVLGDLHEALWQDTA